MFSDMLVSPVKHYYQENLCITLESIIRQHPAGNLLDTDKEYEQTKLRKRTSLRQIIAGGG